jgi:hypothetical protein
LLFYTSAYSTPLDDPGKAMRFLPDATGVQHLSFEALSSGITIAKRAIQLIIFYISRRFVGHSPSGFIFWISTSLGFISVFMFAYSVLRLWRLGFRRSVFQWTGIASFSLLGSLLVFMSRRNVMPNERHSPGSDGFWLAVVALSILYICYALRGQLIRIPIQVRMPHIFVVTLSGLAFLSLHRSVRAFAEPATFPKSCTDCTQSYPLRRDICFRKCFVFGDERSTYQLALMKMGGMGIEKLPSRINAAGMQIVTIMPSKLMNDYIQQFVLRDASRSNLLSYSPLRERPIAPLFKSPYTMKMDWSANKSKNIHPLAFTTDLLDELIAVIKRSGDTYQFRQGVVLLYAAEMNTIAKQVADALKNAGFQEVPNPSLAEANKNNPSLIAKCFAPLLTQESSFSTCKDREF